MTIVASLPAGLHRRWRSPHLSARLPLLGCARTDPRTAGPAQRPGQLGRPALEWAYGPCASSKTGSRYPSRAPKGS